MAGIGSAQPRTVLIFSTSILRIGFDGRPKACNSATHSMDVLISFFFFLIPQHYPGRGIIMSLRVSDRPKQWPICSPAV